MTTDVREQAGARFPMLFEPDTIAGMTVKNRIALLPMGTFPSFSDELFAFYRERARGGAGILMMNRAKVSPVGLGGRHLENAISSSIWDDRNADGWKRLAGTITSNGARAVLQIDHEGIEAGMGAPSDVQPVGPSAVSVPPHPLFRPNPTVARALTTQEVRDFVDAYVQAAYRAQQYGWDGVQIYAGQGVLPMQFLSPRTNLREDEYGGSLENRLRFLLEIAAGIKQVCGRNYPVFVRLATDEGKEAGITIEEGSRIALGVDRCGDVDVVDLSYGTHTSPVPMAMPPPLFPEGALLVYADRVRDEIQNVKLMGVGGIYQPASAERLLQEGRCDLIGMGRALIADPYWPVKAQEGRTDDITTCIGCLKCFERSAEGGTGRRCSTNPFFGQEAQYSYELTPAPKRKRVLVAGSGPGGMQAAIFAARRGHDVELWEAAPELGGDLISGSLPPHKERIGDYNRHLQAQMQKAGVCVKAGCCADAESVSRESPDAVIVATGAKRRELRVPGMEKHYVVHAVDALLGRVPVKGTRAAIIGGGAVGLEVADYLADTKGMDVTVVEMMPRMAGELHPYLRKWLQDKLRGGDCIPEGLGARLMTNAECDEITEGGLWVKVKRGDAVAREFIEADTILIAVGQVENTDLVDALQGKVPELHAIGNCAQPAGRIFESVQDAMAIGLTI